MPCKGKFLVLLESMNFSVRYLMWALRTYEPLQHTDFNRSKCTFTCMFDVRCIDNCWCHFFHLSHSHSHSHSQGRYGVVASQKHIGLWMNHTADFERETEEGMDRKWLQICDWYYLCISNDGAPTLYHTHNSFSLMILRDEKSSMFFERGVALNAHSNMHKIICPFEWQKWEANMASFYFDAIIRSSGGTPNTHFNFVCPFNAYVTLMWAFSISIH